MSIVVSFEVLNNKSPLTRIPEKRGNNNHEIASIFNSFKQFFE